MLPSVDTIIKPGPTRSPWHLLRALVFFAGGLGLVLMAIMAGIRHDDDFATGSNIKQLRLRGLPSSRIVLVGGSNLAFGIDSALLESTTGRPVANMGLNGYLGIRYMLAEVRAALSRGDVVVMAFEYDNYVKSVEGSPLDHMMLSTSNLGAVKYLSWAQRLHAVRYAPAVANSKVEWALEGFLASRLGIPTDPRAALYQQFETARGLTATGDLVSHLDLRWPYALEDGLDLTTLPIDAEVLPMLRAFSSEMRARGVTPIVSYTPVSRTFYGRHRDAIERLHGQLRSWGGLTVPNGPGAFVFDDSLFFDTVYHLGREGRELRTARLAADILNTLSGTTCQDEDECRGHSHE